MIAGPVASSAEKNTSGFLKGGQLIHYDYLGGTVQLESIENVLHKNEGI